VATAVEEVEDLFSDLGLHGDDALIIEEPESCGEHSPEEDVEGVACPGESEMIFPRALLSGLSYLSWKGTFRTVR
jgi:hypothetical protein